MSELISKEEALKELEKLADYWFINNAVQHGIYEAYDLVNNLPSIEERGNNNAVD